MANPEHSHTEESMREGLQSSDMGLGEAEPWEDWETKLVSWSIGLGLGGLVILGTLINIFILNK